MGYSNNDTVTITTGDVEIGAVELKNAADDTRAKIAASGSVAEGDNVVGVQAPVLGATTGAAVITDANGTIQQYLRGLIVKVLLLGLETTQVLIRKAIAPTLAAPVSFAVSGADAGSGALAAGNYVLSCDVAIWWRVNAAAGGTAASVGGAGCKLLAVGAESELIPVVANGEIRAITTGGGGFATHQAAT